MAERGEELDEAKHLVGTWEHDAFASGAIGFRESGSDTAAMIMFWLLPSALTG